MRAAPHSVNRSCPSSKMKVPPSPMSDGLERQTARRCGPRSSASSAQHHVVGAFSVQERDTCSLARPIWGAPVLGSAHRRLGPLQPQRHLRASRAVGGSGGQTPRHWSGNGRAGGARAALARRRSGPESTKEHCPSRCPLMRSGAPRPQPGSGHKNIGQGNGGRVWRRSAAQEGGTQRRGGEGDNCTPTRQVANAP